MLAFTLSRPLRLRIAPASPRTPRRPRTVCATPQVTAPVAVPLSQALDTAPAEPGIYRFLDQENHPLYIGKARRLSARLRQYLTPSKSSTTGVEPANVSARIAAMLADAASLDFVVTQSESAALALEASLIAEHRPRYNVLLKDDRRHPYALITFSEPYPRIVVTRTRKKRPADKLYGPFVDESRLRRLLAVIHASFPLRQRKRPLFTDRPCINYDLGRCPGVCQQLISQQRYAETIHQVDKLLSGRVEEVLHSLRQEMNRLSKAMEYEQAAVVRDRIASLEAVFYSAPLVEGLQQDFIEESLTAANVVSQNAFAFRDIFAISTTGTVSKAVLFQIRGGKVISRLVFSVAAGDVSDGELLSAVLSSHYARTTHPMEIPEEVILCTRVPDTDQLKSVLSEKRGKAVSVRGNRGLGGLSKIVQRNADMEVSLEHERSKHVANDLKALAQLLEPYFGGKSQTSSLNLNRIECYDISHTSGSNAVGSMAVFLDGSAAPSEYRRYNLNENSSYRGHPDDFESIRETLRRRLRQFSDNHVDQKVEMISPSSTQSLPGLLVIDGGKGQLSAAAEVLQDLGLHDTVPLISVAKGEEAIFVDRISKPINFDEDTGCCVMNDGVRLVCRIRDEAHRTAVSAHRKRRGKQALRSGLDSVGGLGTAKRAALLEHFNGSPEAIASASTAQLAKAPGIGPTLATRIHDHFHYSSEPSTGNVNEDIP